MKRTVGFGDFLLRLSPPGYRRFSQAYAFETYYTGAEANVCASLAVMGEEASFVTRVPENAIAETGLGELRRLKVDVSGVVRGGERLGVYYVEKGASQRPSKVVYDRMHSGVTGASRGDFDWKRLLKGAGVFHFTGITPALGGMLPEIVEDACTAAKAAGARISCDLNYRKNLWDTKTASKVMTRLLGHVDYLIANEEDAEKVLGIRADDTDVTGGKLSRDGYIGVARKLMTRFSNLKTVAITLRRSVSASDNVWGAMLYDGKKAFFSKDYNVHIVDRVGGGDSFAAGLLYAFGHRFSPQDAIEYAAAASCLKHSIELDVNLATVPEILQLMKGDGSGRVQR
ncbi:MAG: 2-dehydro-3-deoxygluconokinase [Verrucomicrobia bacterium ADurb.Bin345]|nr:MAG: 2-dehydro-3-deoxygluconokinase [Verrucomicrobia bacterium ADurb.Bin345]